MRRRSLLALVPALAVLLAGHAATAQSPTVDEIIARNIEAKGGMARIQDVESIRQTAEFTVQGIVGELTVYSMRPNLMRQEMRVGPETIINGFDGETPWMVNPMSGTSQATVVTGPQAEMIRRSAAFDGPLVNHKERNITATLEGAETIDGRPTHHLRLTHPDGQVQHIYIDQETALETRIVSEAPEGRVEQRLSDFREVDGVTLPFAVQVVTGGTVTGSMKVQKVELNPSIEVSLFRIPR